MSLKKKKYRYTKNEHYPMEHLVFKTDPEFLQECLDVDHEVWTLGEGLHKEFDHIPFLYKEVWLNENNPGEIHYIFAWEDMDAWKHIARQDIQDMLEAEFAAKCDKPYELIRCVEQEENYGIHRYSRFERIEDDED